MLHELPTKLQNQWKVKAEKLFISLERPESFFNLSVVESIRKELLGNTS